MIDAQSPLSNSDNNVQIAITPCERYGEDYGTDASRVISPDDCRQAADLVRLLSGYEQTPLLEDGRLADECGVASVLIKHEGYRAPTHSFKVLGPPYALARHLLSRLDLGHHNPRELVNGKLRSRVRHHTACAATSGNHGRALAWAAATYGCPCRIYMPESTGAFREEQIQQFGAETVRVAGTYDDAVRRAVLDSERPGFVLVGDGARPDAGVLRHIIHGYSVVGEELVSAIETGATATHVFVPAGSGSLAAAVTARLWMAYGAKRPKIVVVQPHSADSGYQSCMNASRTASKGDLATVMDGLSVRELSADSWAILGSGAFAFITVHDNPALSMLRRLSRHGELTIGETGIAALAGFKAAVGDPNVRQRLHLDQSSRVILIASEGITDPLVLDKLLSPFLSSDQ